MEKVAEKETIQISQSNHLYWFFPNDAHLESDPNNSRPGKSLEIEMKGRILSNKSW